MYTYLYIDIGISYHSATSDIKLGAKTRKGLLVF